MELSLRNLKTTLQMDHLSCKNPENLEREIRMHFLVHNLVRRLMLEAARRHRVPLERVSFAGSLAAARRYGEALLQTRSKRQRRELMEELLRCFSRRLGSGSPGPSRTQGREAPPQTLSALNAPPPQVQGNRASR